ncbi:nitrilase [Neisseria sp. HSC-16F19]|nr:carbon-nitrogen hydrolase family protein [Neisseria sp. HSC-16F19]MCP2041266.1 nitrilase [Neisseria sp. HSC-16F19]
MQTDIHAAVVQMVSGTDVAANVATMQRLVAEAAATGAHWVVLPEYWPLMGAEETDKLAYAEEPGSGPLQTALSEAARRHGIVLFGGSIPLAADTPDKVHNTLITCLPDGSVAGQYHKMHLFGFTGLGEHYAEGDTIRRGGQVPALTVEGVTVAQGICYDARFPEFFRAQLPFEVLVLPAAFTHTTGQAHWELLLRARAVENQCYVLASGQGGRHDNGRRTFGHSMIIDPWGDVLACLPEGEGVVHAVLSAQRLSSVRSKLPALQHRLL